MIDIEKKEKMTKEAMTTMTVKKKYVSSTYLKNVDEYEYNFYEDKENNCYISIKKIISIKEPFCTPSSGCLIDNNYTIVEIVPVNENYCIRAFVNNEKNVILYYFDITLRNGFDFNVNSPYYEDLFIDVILKNNTISVLDENELKEALEEEVITTKEFNLAQTVKSKLIESLETNSNKYMKIDLKKYLK